MDGVLLTVGKVLLTVGGILFTVGGVLVTVGGVLASTIRVLASTVGGVLLTVGGVLVTVGILVIVRGDAGVITGGILARDEKKFRTLFSSIALPVKCSVQGISIPPCGRSLKYHLPPVTLQYIAPPCVINFEHTIEMFLGTCPTVSSTLQTATAYRPLRLSSFLHVSTSPRKGDQIF